MKRAPCRCAICAHVRRNVLAEVPHPPAPPRHKIRLRVRQGPMLRVRDILRTVG